MPKCGRRSDVPSFETEIGGIFNRDLVNRNAPFGTHYTPSLRTKIVGGKPMIIQETQRVQRQPNLVEDTRQTAQKSMHDDAVQADAKETYPQPQVPNSDTSIPKLQQQDLYWNNHNIVPPISTRPSADHQVTKEKDNMTRDSIDNFIKQNKAAADQQMSDLKPIDTSNYAPKNFSQESPKHEHQWKPVAGYSYLPTKPVPLTKEQEFFVVDKLARELSGCGLEQVRAVYREITAIDHQLTGWTGFADFGLALQKHGIYPNMNTLRLLASTCVSSQEPGIIDYEKLLSYIITAIKQSPKASELSPRYYLSEEEAEREKQQAFDDKPPTQEMATSEGQLLRMVQQQLLQSSKPVDIGKLRAAFTQADRSFRLTLSHGEIKDICYRLNIPIQGNIINQMLSHCHTHGDGQYVWTDFIKILEKVLPQQTGLFIPASKRPAEYAKKYLQPNESWPHPDPNPLRSSQNEDDPPPQQINKQTYQQYDYQPPALPSKSSWTERQTAQQNVSGGSGSYANLPPVRSISFKEAPPSPPPRVPVREPLKTVPWNKKAADNWFDGFKRMAEALYRNDLSKQGSMKADQCKWFITEYNDIYGLRFHPSTIEACVNKSTTASGTDIDGLLSSLLYNKPE